MLQDREIVNAKGRVKIDIYDENKNIIETIEKHNLVVNDSSKILAKALSNPSGFTDVHFTYVANTTEYTNADGYYELQMPYHKCKLVKLNILTTEIISPSTLGVEGVAESVIQLEEMYRPIDSIAFAKGINPVRSQVLKKDIDVFVVDSIRGIIGFSFDVTEYDSIDLELYVIENLSVEIVPGSEVVETAVRHYRSKTLNEKGQYILDDSNEFVYGIDYKTGKIFFSSRMSNVRVRYKYKIANGINYMGISDKPEGHPSGRPVTISESQKFKKGLDAEYENSRQPLIFPSLVEYGSLRKEAFAGTAVVDKKLKLDNAYPIYELVSVEDTMAERTYIVSNTPTPDVPYSCWVADFEKGIIEFSSEPTRTDDIILSVAYKLDDAVTVNFVADFAPGLPQPRKATTSEEFVAVNSAMNPEQLYPLKNTGLIRIITVYDKDNPKNTVDASIVEDKLHLATEPVDGKTYVVEYEYYRRSFDIYEVGLFNGDDPETSHMFSIAGIGPIVKAENTGMRITWSITFETFRK